QERLLARRDDPETSKDAARRVAPRLVECQEKALEIIRVCGPGTLRQIATRFTGGPDEMTPVMYHELARRAPELARLDLIDYQRDALGRVVKVDGCRVWEVIDSPAPRVPASP
ncbi:MAG: hypothetical protein KJ748_03285, partial [Gammaproteobacteria bacterium]|nr:hypothetical protein [Gammaproteobacteria bacterium]